MKIDNFLKKMIDWEAYQNPGRVIMSAPFREVVDFKRDASRAGMDFDDACRLYVAKNYEKTSVTDRGGYPKYKLKRCPESIF